MAPSDKLRGKGRCGVLAGKTVWSTPERLRSEVLTMRRYTNLPLPYLVWLSVPSQLIGWKDSSLKWSVVCWVGHQTLLTHSLFFTVGCVESVQQCAVDMTHTMRTRLGSVLMVMDSYSVSHGVDSLWELCWVRKEGHLETVLLLV